MKVHLLSLFFIVICIKKVIKMSVRVFNFEIFLVNKGFVSLL